MDKITLKLRSFFVLAILALLGSAVQTQAQFPTGSYTNNFATGGATAPFSGSGSVTSWLYWYSAPGNNTPMTNDVTTPDTLGGPGAGSLEVYTPFGAGGNQNLFFGTFGNNGGYDFSVTANLLNFDTVSFDVFVGTNNTTPPDANGNWGVITVGVINTSYGFEAFGNGNVTIPGAASNGWVHLSAPIDHTIANITSIPGICFDYNNYSSGYPHAPLTYWLGNLVVHYNGAPPPPPVASVVKVAPGLTQFADAQPSYNRQDIRTDQSGTANLTFYNQSGPVTYSWTIASFPGAAYSNFLAGFTLTPDPVSSEDYSDPDWTATNVLWVAMQNNADGTVTAGIAYKTNQPTANGQLYAAPTDMVPYNNETNGLTVPSAIGTWSLRVSGNTSLTLTAPNGSSTNVTLDPNVAALFNGYVGAYLYSSPTANANIGQYCTYSAYKITGVGTPVNEDLTSGALSSPFLILNSQNYFYTGDYTNNPPNQIFVTGNDAYWFAWTVPDAGFSPVTSASLSDPVWNDINEPSFQNGARKWLKVSKSDLPDASQGYFGLIQRKFTQLLVLLPGETNAPGTSTGKIGSPTPVSLAAGGDEDVSVLAVDSTFHPVSGVLDTISLTSNDTGPTGPLTPNPTAMVNGVASFTGQNDYGFGDTGTFVITATDSTSTNIATANSSPVVVGP